MADWSGMIGNGVSALLGAGIGGYAAWKAACKAGEDASALARAERQADALDRRAELARGKAMDLRTVVAESLIHLNNLDFLYRQAAAKRMERQDVGDQKIHQAGRDFPQLILQSGAVPLR